MKLRKLLAWIPIIGYAFVVDRLHEDDHDWEIQNASYHEVCLIVLGIGALELIGCFFWA